MDKKYRWLLQIWYGGAWRDMWGSDKRSDLAEYLEKCPDDMKGRIIDTTEEEVTKKYGRRRD